MYLEINGKNCSLDKDTDFDPLSNMGFEIFSSLRRLNTCDVQAWIDNYGNTLLPIPQQSAGYRRMKHHRDDRDPHVTFKYNQIKDVWVSRMKTVLQDNSHTLETETETELKVCKLSEEEGYFEGEDATELWQGDYVFDIMRESMGTATVYDMKPGSGKGPRRDCCWPFSTETNASYSGFRKQTPWSECLGKDVDIKLGRRVAWYRRSNPPAGI